MGKPGRLALHLVLGIVRVGDQLRLLIRACSCHQGIIVGIDPDRLLDDRIEHVPQPAMSCYAAILLIPDVEEIHVELLVDDFGNAGILKKVVEHPVDVDCAIPLECVPCIGLLGESTEDLLWIEDKLLRRMRRILEETQTVDYALGSRSLAKVLLLLGSEQVQIGAVLKGHVEAP